MKHIHTILLALLVVSSIANGFLIQHNTTEVKRRLGYVSNAVHESSADIQQQIKWSADKVTGEIRDLDFIPRKPACIGECAKQRARLAAESAESMRKMFEKLGVPYPGKNE